MKYDNFSKKIKLFKKTKIKHRTMNKNLNTKENKIFKIQQDNNHIGDVDAFDISEEFYYFFIKYLCISIIFYWFSIKGQKGVYLEIVPYLLRDFPYLTYVLASIMVFKNSVIFIYNYL